MNAESKELALGAGSQDMLERLKMRVEQIERAWVFDHFIVVRSGNQLKYCPRKEPPLFGGFVTESQDFALELGPEIWIQDFYQTGVMDLIQLLVLDDVNQRLFIITWNLTNNREHSLFQSTYREDVFPENCILHGWGQEKAQDFNFYID